MTTAALPIWPLRRTADAVAVLARSAGWSSKTGRTTPPQPMGLSGTAAEGTPGSLSDYLEVVSGSLDLESEPVVVPISELPAALRRVAPALLWVRVPQEGLLLVLAARGGWLKVIAPDGATRYLRRSEVEAALLEPEFHSLRPEIERLLKATGVSGAKRKEHAARIILEARLGDRPIPGIFLLRLGLGRPLAQQIADAGLWRLGSYYGITHLVQYALALLLFYVIGQCTLNGRVEKGWFSAVLLLLVCSPPFILLESWLLGRMAISIGVVLRRRLFWGAVNLPLDATRQNGYGDFLGQSIESEVVEIGLRTGGISAGAALLDLLGASAVLQLAAPTTSLLLLIWVGLVGVTTFGYYRRRRVWTETRFGIISGLLELMLGHRTRLVQEPKGLRHRAEDHALVDYHSRSRVLDAWAAALFGGLPFGWLAVGILSLVPLFLAEDYTAGLALGLGGVLLGFRALSKLASGLSQLAGVLIALRRCKHLLASAAQPIPQPLTSASPSFAKGDVVLEAKRLTVRYDRASIPALRDLTWRVRSGQRVLLQGPSGSGKSTLASSLTGLLSLETGQILLGGLDMAALGGRKWRKLVATAPQFHENHLFSQPLAFNLLLGRAWPPSAEDLAEARQICEELGLGSLLARMPSGLFTQVGQSGWQLSHGERSRVYIARTLLQRAQIVLLDESFAALDPETLKTTLGCVFRRVPTLFVIAHP
jgi:ATP-binding cassette subfamily B protein